MRICCADHDVVTMEQERSSNGYPLVLAVLSDVSPNHEQFTVLT